MKSSSGSGRKVRMILVSITISLLLCMGAGIFLFKWWGSTLPPVVAIQRPESGHMAEVDQVLPFLVSATFDKGISRLELYADGALVGSQDTSLPGGDNPLMMAQSWMPLTTGRHVLMARAYDLQHKFYDSSVVDINVVGKLSDTATINTRDIPLGPNASLPSLSDVALASDTPLDTLRALNPGLGDLAESAPRVSLTPQLLRSSAFWLAACRSVLVWSSVIKFATAPRNTRGGLASPQVEAFEILSTAIRTHSAGGSSTFASAAQLSLETMRTRASF